VIRALLPVIVVGVLGAFFLFCVAMERRRRGVVVVLTLLGVAVVDAALYADTAASSAVSIFHPRVLGQNFRLTQLVIPVAVLARLTAGAYAQRIAASASLWIAFFAWTLVSTVSGLVQGYEAALVLRQATIVIHVGMAMALAAGVPAQDYLRGRALPWFLQGSAVLATVLFVTGTLGIRVSSQALPLLPLVDLGRLGADAATLFGGIGVLGLVVTLAGLGDVRRRAYLYVPCILLTLSHLATAQRAARLGLQVTILVVAIVLLSPTARRRFRWTGTQLLTTAACVVALGLGAVFATAVAAAIGTPSPGVVAVDEAVTAFGATSRQTSVESRYNQWDVIWADIAARPVLGNGLGHTHTHYDAGKREFVDSDISHNIVLDVLRRMGVVGLVFLLLALGMVAAQAIRTWRTHPDNLVAALAMATVAVAAGLLAKGMVESIFEKHRLAVLLGIVLGMAMSAGLARRDAEPADPEAATRALTRAPSA
jgi:O-antigen ligase